MQFNIGSNGTAEFDAKIASDMALAREKGDDAGYVRVMTLHAVAHALRTVLAASPHLLAEDSSVAAAEQESKAMIEGIAYALGAIYSPQIVGQTHIDCKCSPPCAWMDNASVIAGTFCEAFMGYCQSCFIEQAQGSAIHQHHHGSA